MEFDDEQPIIRKEDDIVKLSGGGETPLVLLPCVLLSLSVSHIASSSMRLLFIAGDWHMAYILLYKARLA